ncbi:GAF domain-containing protein [Vibrio sp. vnigr-6D03]|uniref:GAF domain-containing protein n=1 Tax=Vibrio sp. vnigr-6D03 TaxID=2058088 RepID=UPI000C346289|nr:GAF domain-containing protein [Vibrio sp. vnigr-6D03]PKF80065.1 GAF domain-containing protein [Vibrio sp. vnigr-6D03]
MTEAYLSFESTQQQLKRAVGFKLMTIMCLTNSQACRCYTSDTEHYPVSGVKPLEFDDWHQHVVVEATPFVCNERALLDKHLKDSDLFERLELGSAINLPVMFQDEVIGTINLLDEEGAYFSIDLPNAMEVAQQVAPDLMAFRRALEK